MSGGDTVVFMPKSRCRSCLDTRLDKKFKVFIEKLPIVLEFFLGDIEFSNTQVIDMGKRAKCHSSYTSCLIPRISYIAVTVTSKF